LIGENGRSALRLNVDEPTFVAMHIAISVKGIHFINIGFGEHSVATWKSQQPFQSYPRYNLHQPRWCMG
jgi:hypothetical protein